MIARCLRSIGRHSNSIRPFVVCDGEFVVRGASVRSFRNQTRCFADSSDHSHQSADSWNVGSRIPSPEEGWRDEESGISVQDVLLGEGAEPEIGEYVQVRYRGMLESGSTFEDRWAKPKSYLHLTNQVVMGLDAAVDGMREGGRRWVRVPPELGYGWKAMPKIPKNSTLYFQVELVRVGSSAAPEDPSFWEAAKKLFG